MKGTDRRGLKNRAAVPLWALLVAGSYVLGVSLGTRHTFGVFLKPISKARGWGREVFSLAIAVQNLVWGVTQPFTGYLADHIGAGYLVAGGVLSIMGGLMLTTAATTQWQLHVSLGVLVGLGMSGCTFPCVFGPISRRISSPAERSRMFGLTTATTSLTQCVFLPLTRWLSERVGYGMTLHILAFLCLSALPCALLLLERDRHRLPPTLGPSPTDSACESEVSSAQSSPDRRLTGPPEAEACPTSALDHLSTARALRAALPSKALWQLSLAFMVCGYHVVLIGTHLPAYVVDQGLASSVGFSALALIGLFNVFGTYLAGWAGARSNKAWLLAGLYAVRTITIGVYVRGFEVTPWSTYIFSAIMGVCWLATVPLTNAMLASVYGVRHMSLFSGIAFLFHQIGSFLSGWGGGYVYDVTGSYLPVWVAAAAGGAVATLLVLPVKEEPLLAIDLKVGGPAVELPCKKAVQGLVTVSIDDEGKDMRV